MLIPELQSHIRSCLQENFGIAVEQVSIEIPGDRAFGDFTINGFSIAKAARVAPPRVLPVLEEALRARPDVESVTVVKGFLNFRLKTSHLLPQAIAAVLGDPRYGAHSELSGRRIMVEYSAPNTNKPQHLGHMRNNFLGHSISAILANAGAEVIRANLFNDRGIHICKSMLAYQKFGEERTPETEGKKGDHFVGEFYVLFERKFREQIDEYVARNPAEFEDWKTRQTGGRRGAPLTEAELEKAWRESFREEGFAKIPLGSECSRMLREWEAHEPEVHALWLKMNAWAIAGFLKTYEDLGVSFDRIYRESETWQLGKDLILDGLSRNVFAKREDGAIEIDLRADKLDKKVVLRSDGTAVYITQDIGTTVMKATENRLDGQVWVVGDEQKFHFQVLFKILQRMGYAWADHLYHLAYGMVNLPDGKMKSREGRVVDADDLLSEVSSLAAEQMRIRDPEQSIPAAEIARRSRVLGLSALRFMLLKVTPQSGMTFDPGESVRFDGDTGARVLYAYARLSGLVNEGHTIPAAAPSDLCRLEDEAERALALDLVGYPAVTLRAARDHNPGAIANYLIDLVRNLNRFYDRCPVLKEASESLGRARLDLCRATRQVLAHGTRLLGMPTLERM